MLPVPRWAGARPAALQAVLPERRGLWAAFQVQPPANTSTRPREVCPGSADGSAPKPRKPPTGAGTLDGPMGVAGPEGLFLVLEKRSPSRANSCHFRAPTWMPGGGASSEGHCVIAQGRASRSWPRPPPPASSRFPASAVALTQGSVMTNG